MYCSFKRLKLNSNYQIIRGFWLFCRLEQFNDVFYQENICSYDMGRPLFDFTDLQTIETEKYISVEFVQVCRVGPIDHLGD